MYWISKQHKNPYKFRFIAGASNCTTKKLAIELSLILNLIKQHFKNYCHKIEKLNGYCMYWSIDHSLQCLHKLQSLKAESIFTFDFSTLYTNLPLDDIYNHLSSLICRMFKNANSKYILVNNYTKKAFWHNDRKNGYSIYTLDLVLDTLNFILHNSYVMFGPYIFLQTKGIPMGGNASPLIADLYLSWLEFTYLNELVKKKKFQLVHKLKHVSRYIDDIITPNLDIFLEIAKDIYPSDIPLEASKTNGFNDTFLDLDVTVHQGCFIFKVFHKIDLFNFDVISYPFLDSNIPQRICYNTFFSQLIRFTRISSTRSGFAERVQLIYNKLSNRGYNTVLLNKTFSRFLCKYSHEVIKFDVDLGDLLQFCLNYKVDDIIDNETIPDIDCVLSQICDFHTISPVPLDNLGNTCYINCILQCLFQLSRIYSFDIWFKHLIFLDKSRYGNSLQLLLFYKFLYFCSCTNILQAELADFVWLLHEINQFFNTSTQRDVHEALMLLFDMFNNVCQMYVGDSDYSDVPDFMDYYLSGVLIKHFVCTSCHQNNDTYDSFRFFIIKPDDDIDKFFSNMQVEAVTATCNSCNITSKQKLFTKIHDYPRVLLFQINRFTFSRYNRNRKNNQPFAIKEHVKFGLVNYSLFCLIEHHGVTSESGHYTCFTGTHAKWFLCNDSRIIETVLPRASQDAYLLFYFKQ